MKDEIKALARHRLQKAKETLKEAEILFDKSFLGGAMNRCYYAVFYAARSLLALKELDSAKHSGVIALFNKHILKEGLVSRNLGRTFTELFENRSEGDYEDFKSFTNNDLIIAFGKTGAFIQEVEEALIKAIATKELPL